MMVYGEFAQSRETEDDVRPPAGPICSGDWSCVYLPCIESVSLCNPGLPAALNLVQPSVIGKSPVAVGVGVLGLNSFCSGL